jgi:trk system potassium uptake protein TrkH
MAIVGTSWLLAAAIGALPYLLGGMTPGSACDAYFESMSGLTTTGSTILTDIEGQTRALLFWRAMTHFIGGLGIVVLFVVVLPEIGVGGKALFKREVPGPFDESTTPRIRDTAITLFKLYLAFNVAEAVMLMLAGMSVFDATCHALATIATGGFSTRNQSVYSFHNPAAEWIIIVFMFLSGTNFALHLEALKGKFSAYWRDPEFRLYAAVTAGGATLAAILIYFSNVTNPVDPLATPYVNNPGGFNLRDTLFMFFAVGTSTGFGTVDYEGWPPVLRLAMLFLMVTGACAGSTSGGLKLVRVLTLARVVIHKVRVEVRPNLVRCLRIGGKVIPAHAVESVLVFSAIWMMTLAGMSAAVALLSPGQSILTSVSAVVTCMSNIGPGLEGVGPAANFASQTPLVKWLLSVTMLLGRLEIFSVAVLFSPRFWFPK